MDELSDNELVARYVKGNNKAFEFLVSRYADHIFNFILRYSGDSAIADDLAQETFLKVWKNIKKFDQTKSFKSWIFTIARNTTLDWLRKKKAIPFSTFETEENEVFDVADVEPLAHELFDDVIMREQVVRAVKKLPPQSQTVLFLRYDEDLTFQEIGEILGESLNTVKSRYRRALMELKKSLST